MNYTFKIVCATLSIDEYVNPTNAEQLKIIPFRTDGQKFIRNKISENVILSGTEFSTYYNYLKENPCTQFEFQIWSTCDLSEPFFSGLFTFFNIGTINEDRCWFDFGMITDDIYTRFMNKWKDKFNILNTNLSYLPNDEINPPIECQVVFDVQTEVKCETVDIVFTPEITEHSPDCNSVDATFINTYFPSVDQYNVNHVEIISNYVFAYYDPSIPADFYTTTWYVKACSIREILLIPKINGTWATPPIVTPLWVYIGFEIVNGNQNKKYARPYQPPSTWACSYVDPIHFYELIPTTSIVFNNCRILRSVIDYMLLESGFNNHQSNFFYSETNPLTGQTGYKLKNLLIGQKSDFIPPIGSNVATKSMWNLEDCLTFLRDTFNVYWYFNNNVLYLEHEIFFEKGLSYTTSNIQILPIDDKYLAESNKFSIDFSKYVGFEKFENSEQDGIDFIGLPIKYGDCLPDKNSEKLRSINNITFDITDVYYQLSQISEDGLVLLQTKFVASETPQYRIENEIGIIAPTKTYTNGHLAWAMLQEKYWKPGVRLLPSFNMNGIDINKNTNPEILTEKVKVQQEISFPYCCEPLNFYAMLKINDLPEAKFTEAGFSLKTEFLTVKLAYDL